MKRPTAHFRAKRAGVGLAPDVEDNLGYVGFDELVFYSVAAAELLYLGIVRALEAHVHRDGEELVFFRVKKPHFGKRGNEGEGILSARNTDGNSVAFLYHSIVVHSPPDEAEHSFHCVHFNENLLVCII